MIGGRGRGCGGGGGGGPGKIQATHTQGDFGGRERERISKCFSVPVNLVGYITTKLITYKPQTQFINYNKLCRSLKIQLCEVKSKQANKQTKKPPPTTNKINNQLHFVRNINFLERAEDRVHGNISEKHLQRICSKNLSQTSMTSKEYNKT